MSGEGGGLTNQYSSSFIDSITSCTNGHYLLIVTASFLSSTNLELDSIVDSVHAFHLLKNKRGDKKDVAAAVTAAAVAADGFNW